MKTGARRLPGLPTRTDGTGGFTLLEVMVAVAVLAVAMVALLKGAFQIQEAALRSQSLSIASTLATGKMRELMQPDYALSESGEEGDFGEEYPEYAWDYQVRIYEDTESFLDGFKRITLNVEWRSVRTRRESGGLVERLFTRDEAEGVARNLITVERLVRADQ